jgi:tRNA threonylcarbamoyl adenosine modification protein YeaZ
MPENIFLGIDCSGVVAELALVTADGREFTTREDTPRQADVIFPLLEKLLADACIKTQDLTAIGAITGPGSFTGIRVGLSLAQGLADGLGVPAYGIDAFAALETLEARGEKLENIIFVLESKREELFVKYHDKIKMLRSEEILKLADKNKTIIHNLTNHSSFSPLDSSVSMALAAVRHAQLCMQQKIPGKNLTPYYVREADAKPSAA